MRVTPKRIFKLLKETGKEWSLDKTPRLAAALSYYTIFSIAPLLIIVIAIAGLVFGEEAVRGQIVGQLEGLIGNQGAEVIQTAIANAYQPGGNTGTIASIMSIIVLIFGATGVFAQLQDALNTIWDVKPKPGRGLKNFFRKRILSFAAILGIGFLLLVSLVINAALSGISAYMGHLLPGAEMLWQLLNFVVSFAIITLLFAFIYKYLPDVNIRWKDVWVGAIITALLFTIGKYLLGAYLGRGSFGSTYGAAGSLVIFLVWVYYSAQILFFGAEFTQVYARRYGSQIEPDENAMRLTEEDRTRQGISKH
ncbi:MAG: YihY/virulence factor BrkB family protein [Chroococcales cyanobacterium]